MRVWLRIVMVLVVWSSFQQMGWARELFSFKGQVDLTRDQLDLVLHWGEAQQVRTRLSKTASQAYHLQAKAEHVQTRLFDLSSEFHGDFHWIPSGSAKGPALEGKLWSQYALIDYQPTADLKGRFRLDGKALQLHQLSFAGITLDGAVQFAAPHQIDMRLGLHQIGMGAFLDFWTLKRTYEATGTVFGEIWASGNAENLLLQAQLKGEDGKIKKLVYDHIVLNLQGVYPNMRIADSFITKDDGLIFTLDGPFDLMDKRNFKKQIRALSLAPMVTDSAGEREWTIRRLHDDEAAGFTDLKYLMRKDPASGSRLEESSTMLGIERTLEF